MNLQAIYIALLAAAGVVLLPGCGSDVPTDSTPAARQPRVSPDYTALTIPRNIAPLRFAIDEDGSEWVTRYRAGDASLTVGGRNPKVDIGQWHKLLAEADTVYADVYVRGAEGWTRFDPIVYVVADSIDPYISYRLIEPSYIGFEEMAICERNLENFDQHDILNNQAMSTEDVGQCLNCHSYQAHNAGGAMQLHARIGHGGTLVTRDGKLEKINLKSDETVSSGVYPSWHPQLPLIAYSVNSTSQTFHTRDANKVEVQDSESDLVLYDVEANKASFISHDPAQLETFPYWHPDVRSLWYVSAQLPDLGDKELNVYMSTNYKDFRYDLYRRAFDPESRTFGPVDTVWAASVDSLSVTLPRPSPAGRYVMVTVGSFGTFHIWHRDADLWLLDLADGSLRPLDELNSDNVESYHSWSSSGRWVIFSSRRDDGSYTRLYMAHLGDDGRFSKPFVLPQASADHNTKLFKSYNVPEFMVKPVAFSRNDFIEALSREAVAVEYR